MIRDEAQSASTKPATGKTDIKQVDPDTVGDTGKDF